MSPIAYDIGPANGLLDAAIFAYTKGEQSFDRDGVIAASGTVDTVLLKKFLDEPYYALSAPKSTGKELFHLPYLIEKIGPLETWNIMTVMATLLKLTVETVAREVEKYHLTKLYIAGGGSANPVMMAQLQKRLTSCKVVSMLELGIDPRAKEGLTFALIGFLSMNGQAGQIPSCTGARGERILGSFTPGNKPLQLPEPSRTKPSELKVIE